MTNIIITQENTLFINSNTYIIHPGDHFNINEQNIWYINTDQAPDFKNVQNEYESNNLTMFIPEDKYTTITHDYSGLNGISTVEGITDTHENILNNCLTTLNVPEKCTIKYYDNFCYIVSESRTELPSLLCGNTINSVQDALITQHSYYKSHYSNYVIPLIKTFSILLHKDDTQYIISSSSDIQPNSYTYSTYHNILTKIEGRGDTLNQTFYVGYVEQNKIPRYYLHRSSIDFSSGFGIIHTVQQDVMQTLNFPPVNRTIRVPSTNYTTQSLCDYLTNNNFTATSDNHFIYINSDARFIFQPVTVLENTFMDKSTEYTTSKRLMNTAHYQNISATVNGDIIEGYYTPAELLRKISIDYNNPVTVINNNIKFQYPISISCIWFECNETEVVNNVNLSVIQSKIELNNNEHKILSVNGYHNFKNSIIGYQCEMYSNPTLYKFDNGFIKDSVDIQTVDILLNNNSYVYTIAKEGYYMFDLEITNNDITKCGQLTMQSDNNYNFFELNHYINITPCKIFLYLHNDITFETNCNINIKGNISYIQ